MCGQRAVWAFPPHLPYVNINHNNPNPKQLLRQETPPFRPSLSPRTDALLRQQAQRLQQGLVLALSSAPPPEQQQQPPQRERQRPRRRQEQEQGREEAARGGQPARRSQEEGRQQEQGGPGPASPGFLRRMQRHALRQVCLGLDMGWAGSWLVLIVASSTQQTQPHGNDNGRSRWRRAGGCARRRRRGPSAPSRPR